MGLLLTTQGKAARYRKEKTVFVLKEPLASEKRGKPVWFRFMTLIGPCSTEDPEERAEFPSLESALRSPAVSHFLTFYEPEEGPAALRAVADEITGVDDV